MNYQAVIDVSIFIWCEKDFAENTNRYYDLALQVPALFEKLNENKSLVLLRNELYTEIMQYFPYSKIPRGFSDFESLTFSFLGSLGSRLITYEGNESNISSIPDLIKVHFSNSTATEVKYLIGKIHTDRAIQSVFFTYSYLYGSKKNLKTVEKENGTVEHFTVVSDVNDHLGSFFSSTKPIFQHSEKHHAGIKKGGYRSRLSCYDERIGNVKAQKILDGATFVDGEYFGYDYEHDVYVVFKNTRLNIYHGYDEEDKGVIPQRVREKFNK